AERQTAIARRKDALTGTSEFPDIAEMPAEVLMPSPLVRGTAGVPPALHPRRKEAPAVPASLPRLRLAEPFEALRDVSDRVRERTGARPKAFLANLGNVADFTARATSAKNFFEAGGIAAVTNDGFASHNEMLSSFNASGASLACLCSSDVVY